MPPRSGGTGSHVEHSCDVIAPPRPKVSSGFAGGRSMIPSDGVHSRRRGPDLLLHVNAGADGSFHRPHGTLRRPARLGRRGFAGVLLPVVAKAELHADLVMADRSVDDMALNLSPLEPFEIPERFSRRLNAMLHGIFDAGFRCSDDLGDAVNMIGHLWSPFEVPRGRVRCGGFRVAQRQPSRRD